MPTEQQLRDLLLDLANEAYMRQDYRCNKRICDLLGVPSAIDHEMADSRPKPDPEYDYRGSY